MAQVAVDFLMGPDWLSRLISYYGQGPNGWSHAASVLSDGRYLDARNDVLAGVPAGVHIRLPSTEKWIRKRRAWKEVTDAQYADWEANLRAKITDPYARGDIETFIFNRDRHKMGTYDCSELAINAMQHIKLVPFPLAIPAHQITPNVCLLLLQAVGFTVDPVQVPLK